MKKAASFKVLSVVLALTMIFSIIPMSAMSTSANSTAKSGDDGTTNWDFIEPVTHQKTVPSGYVGIYTAQDFDNVRNNLSGNYILMNDIDLSSWGNWEPIGKGFIAIEIESSVEFDAAEAQYGKLYYEPTYTHETSYYSWRTTYYYLSSFIGVFDGNGYVVKNLNIYIEDSSDSDDKAYIGFFGSISEGLVKNVGMIESIIKTKIVGYVSYIGGIAGQCFEATIENCYYGGEIFATSSNTWENFWGIPNAGGIVGACGYSATIKNCYNTGEVSAISEGRDAYASGIASDCSGEMFLISDININNCYNLGKITATGASGANASGIACSFYGLNYQSKVKIENCYNAGDVEAETNGNYPCAGGIVAEGYAGRSVTSDYSIDIIKCYNSGIVSATSPYNYYCYEGGIAGNGAYVINDCYYLNNIIKSVDDESKSVLTNVKSLTVNEMRQQSSFVGFDFDTTWAIDPEINDGYPYLRSFNYTTPEPGETTIDFSSSTCSGVIGDQTTLYGNFSSSTLAASSSTITWSCSDPAAVTFGQMTVSGENDNAIISIPVTCNKLGTYTITASTIDGASTICSLTITEEQYYIQVYATSSNLTVNVGESFDIVCSLYKNDKIVNDWDKIALSISNSKVISTSEYTFNSSVYHLTVTGKSKGQSSLTVTDSTSGAYATINITVGEVSPYSYLVDKVPSFYPDVYGDRGTQTNFYNINDLYVNNFSSTKTITEAYTVKFDVYNSSYMYGAVDVYDKSGKWITSEKINKFTDISSLWDTGEAFYYLVKDTWQGKALSYTAASFSKKTIISITVPEGGYFTISNNYAQSPGTFLYNAVDYIMLGVDALIDLAIDGIEVSEIADDIVDKAIKDVDFYELFMKKFNSIALDVSQTALEGGYGNAAGAMTIQAEDLLKSAGIDWKASVKTVLGVGESVFAAITGPVGATLKGMFAFTKLTSTTMQTINLCNSTNAPYITIHTPNSSGSTTIQGVTVTPGANAVDSEAVLQVFRLANDETIIFEDNVQTDNYLLYNICFVKNGSEIQPSGKVTVMIPIPQGYNKDTLKVYHGKGDGTWEEINIRIEGNYIIFETDQFSPFAIVDVSSVQTYTITATAGTGGTVSGGGTFVPNEQVTLIATPSSGYTFDGWYEGNTRVSMNATYSFTATANRTIEARFTRGPSLFTDVSTADWFYDSVMYCYNYSLMQGTSTTTFEPNATLTRAMVATVLYRMEGEPSVTYSKIFTDVSDGKWYSNAVMWAYKNDIVKGYGDGKFGTNDPITREQFATMMYRYAEYKGYDTSVSADFDFSKYEDAGSISRWASNAMRWAIYKGIITGTTNTTLAPQSTATRAQCATILQRYMVNIVS